LRVKYIKKVLGIQNVQNKQEFQHVSPHEIDIHSQRLVEIVLNCASILLSNHIQSFCRVMQCISAAYVSMRCLSVCPSVTCASCAKTNKHMFEIFAPSGSQAILVFPYQMGWRYSDGNPLTRASNAGGKKK